ncbi:MAG: hypothetical protein H6721_34060 [Sandaracinus sp.]|nr:hypothetical protein [Sandaracinus sp.]
MRVFLGLALLLLSACGSEATGPQARIQQFTGCVVPPGAVRVHENVGGDASRFVVHVKVVIPKRAIDAYVASCGFDRAALREGYDHHGMLPADPLVWWTPLDRQLGRGQRIEVDGDVRELVEFERDTDFAVFVRAEGAAR